MTFNKSLLNIAYSLSYKYSDNFHSVDELIGASNIAICNVLKNYNPDKNVKITTYAYKAISREIFKLKNKNNILKQSKSIHNSTSDDKSFEMSVVCESSQNQYNSFDINNLIENIKSELSEAEFQILDLRYGLTQDEMTLVETSKKLNINRETLRRKQKQILQKLYSLYSDKIQINFNTEFQHSIKTIYTQYPNKNTNVLHVESTEPQSHYFETINNKNVKVTVYPPANPAK